MADWLQADWPAPSSVRAGTTLRTGGSSRGPWSSMNLAMHVGDNTDDVLRNRRQLVQDLGLPAQPQWLEQVHGSRCVLLDRAPANSTADAAYTGRSGVVCAVLTADCLPVLLCDLSGSIVAAVHAGWRGLASGVLQNAIASLPVAASDLMAWLGPAIGPQSFEVGAEVRQCFVDVSPVHENAFRPGAGNRWLCDLYQLALNIMCAEGVMNVHGGGRCTYAESGSFFSYRRDEVCGRMASLIWIDPDSA